MSLAQHRATRRGRGTVHGWCYPWEKSRVRKCAGEDSHGIHCLEELPRGSIQPAICLRHPGWGLQTRDMSQIHACSAEVFPSSHRGEGGVVLPSRAVLAWVRVLCPASRTCSGSASREVALPPQLSPPPRRWIPALIVWAQVLGLRQEHAELVEIAEGLLHLQNARAGHSEEGNLSCSSPRNNSEPCIITATLEPQGEKSLSWDNPQCQTCCPHGKLIF